MKDKKGILRSDSNTVCLEERSASLPGPGAYNIRQNFGDVKRGVGFARASRYAKGSLFGSDSLDELDRIVGPGSYNLKSTIPQLQRWVKEKIREKSGKLF